VARDPPGSASVVFSLYFYSVKLTLDRPSYYHLHIHIVHTDFHGSDSMAVGKAWLLDDELEQLSLLGPVGFKEKTMTVIVGEESDLWKRVYSQLRTN
jgi:m7GpppX diphosphatase